METNNSHDASAKPAIPEDALCRCLRDTVVRIDTQSGFGTGFWVSPDLILTCAHVVSQNATPTDPERVTWRDHTSAARVVEAKVEIDLAIIRPSDLGVFPDHPFAILHDEVELDDKLYAFGYSHEYPNGEPFAPQIEGTSPKPLLLKLRDSQIVPGFSGSPILNRRTGAVIGILRKTRDEFSSLGGRAIPISAVHSSFSQLAKAERLSPLLDTVWAKALSSTQLRLLGLGNRSIQRVLPILRLLNYEITDPPSNAGTIIDLLATKHDGDIELKRAIHCCHGPISRPIVEELDGAIHKLKRNGHAYDATIIGTATIDPEAQSYAEQSGIRLTRLHSLESSLINAQAYCQSLIAECESNQRYRIKRFIEPDIGDSLSGNPQNGLTFVRHWLNDPDARQMTLLGDVGTGKTFLSRVSAHTLAKEYLESPESARIPILIDLRNADRQFTLEGLILSHFQQSHLRSVSFPIFMHCLSMGKIALFFDGFDEMAARVTSNVTTRNFHQLARAAVDNSKVFLTCRTHYFRSRTEEEEVVLGGADDGNSNVRDLYLELIDRRGFRIAYLRPFDHVKVESYIRLVRPHDAADVIARIRSVYNLFELCQRPMLLDMIVKTIDKLAAADITSASLYRVYTDAWVQRDGWHDVLSAEQKRTFLIGLARGLWEQQREQVHFSELAQRVERELAAAIETPHDLIEIDNEIRTASFLIRDDVGNYSFAHKSYREYFLAQDLADNLNSGNIQVLNIGRLTAEVCHFLIELCNESVEPTLIEVLRRGYVPAVSENAFLLLYQMYRSTTAQEGNISTLTIALPSGIKLPGADLGGIVLDRMSLEDCDLRRANLNGAFFTDVRIDNSALDDCNCANVKMKGSRFESVSFNGSSLKAAAIEQCAFVHVDFTRANLSGALILESTCERTLFEQTRYLGVCGSSERSEQVARISLVRALEARLPENVVLKGRGEDYAELLPEIRAAARSVARTSGGEEDEIISDIYITLLTKRPKLATMENIRAYFIRLAQVGQLDIIRGKGVFKRSFEAALNKCESRQDSVESSINASLIGQRLLNLIGQQFAPDVVRMFQMRYLQERSLDEVASEFAISPSSVRLRMNRVSAYLRDLPGVRELYEDLVIEGP